MSNSVGGADSNRKPDPLKPKPPSAETQKQEKRKEKLLKIYKKAIEDVKKSTQKVQQMREDLRLLLDEHGEDKDGVKEKKESSKSKIDEWLDSPD